MPETKFKNVKQHPHLWHSINQLRLLLDVIVVFLVTAPLVTMASKSAFWSRPSINGLGAVQQVARERRAVAAAAGAKEL